MALRDFEIKWKAYLKSEDCPPVPGLAPLSEEDSQMIGRLVAAHLKAYSYPPLKIIFALIDAFPACMSVWLARKAGEAYEAGAFWDKFGELIGISIAMNRRDEFAQRFRSAARSTIRT